MSEIAKWLASGKEFSAGLQILNKFSKNEFLKRALASSGATAFNKVKLEQELIILGKAEKPQQKPEMIVVRKEILPDKEYAAAPFDVRKIIAKAKDLIKENGKRHAEIYSYIKEAKATFKMQRTNYANYINGVNKFLKERNVGDIANEILDRDDEIALLFYKVDYWRVHGKLPEEQLKDILPEQDKAELQTTLNNTRSKISKLKNKLNKITDPESDEYKKKYAELDAALLKKEELERSIDALD